MSGMVNDMAPPAPTTDANAASNGGGSSVSSPQSHRRNLTSPWASVVRGDSEQPSAAAAPGSSSSPPAEQQVSVPENTLVENSGSEAQPESPDVNNDTNAGQQRRPVWNRPSNGVVEPASVMGGSVSWPALSEITRPVLRSSTDSPRPVSNGSPSSSQVPIISPPPQRPSNNNAHGNPTGNNTPTRHRRNRNGGGGGGGGGGNSSSSGPSQGSGPSQTTLNQPTLSTPPPFPVFDVMVPVMDTTAIRGSRPQSHTGNNHSLHRNNNSRRGNYGSRPHNTNNNNYNNHGGRRDQDRRDVHHHPQPYVPPMGYMQPHLPPGVGPFIPPPPPVRIFSGYDMASPPFFYVPTMPPESFRAMPPVPSPLPMHFTPSIESSLTQLIVNQIDFYFSEDNLVKDNYLRSNMDDQGWVSVALIASFRRVRDLTKDIPNEIPVILESLRYSTVVEVQGDKLRKRDGWNKWLYSSGRRNSDSGTNAPSSSENVLATSIQQVSLDDATSNVDGNTPGGEALPEMATSSSVSHDELTGESRLTKGDDAADATHRD
ncbi:hypothetical protein CASFOL_021361 [Castilleja foliolosa]|uniref:HTH La-type RNA-binding domain-containing protein n=1 Tax=Castilleja foliolosa TaxID=1961234 RepID=A0ABD3D0H1_9LAMI